MKPTLLRKSFAWGTLFTYLLVFASPAAQAAPGPLANIPLFLASPVQPNVMILIDNSGSMDNIIWAAEYDNTITYADWGQGNGTNRDWNSTNGNKLHSTIDQGGCGSGWKRGNNGTSQKCLKLPDPVTGGNTRYTGNYLNYLFATYADGTDLTQNQIPQSYRMNVAKSVATNVVTGISGMRFGIASFNPSNNTEGGIIGAECKNVDATHKTTLTNAISGLSSATWTPLGEALYEVTRYFRGMTGYYNNGITYTSPIQYRCQKNFTIVITDGLPTYDNNFPSNDPDDTLDATRSLPNWDNQAPATTQAMYPNFPQYSDGFKPASSQGDEGYSLYLDDMAKFATDIDLRKAPANDVTGVSFDDSSNNNEFKKQTLNTYTIGFSAANQMLQDAAAYGGGQYFTAFDEDTLTAALQQVVANIASRVGSAAAVAFNTATLSTNSAVYQARFNSAQWSGELLSYALDPLNGNIASTESWNAAAKLDSQTSRKILTYNPTLKKGIPFTWNTTNLSAAQQSDLNMGTSSVDNKGADRLAYLRGDRSNEGPGTVAAPKLDFRIRASVLGDITHSSPVYVGRPDLPYPDTAPFPTSAGSKYSDFKAAQANRAGIVYVGANDGMLHGFDAATGEETIAYVPHNLFSANATEGLHYLTDKNYQHRYYVDLGPTVSDVYIATTPGGTVGWKTILIGGEGGGGMGLFALDVTNPSAFSESGAVPDDVVMWEFSSADDADLGYTFSKPAVALMNNGKWAVIFGNGYNDGGSGQAKLFIAYLEGGLDGVWTLNTDYLKITTGAGSSGAGANGLASPTLIDLDNNGTVDRVYAGDLQGNMWAFDLSDASASNWGVAYKQGSTPKPLFVAKNAANVAQAITTKVVVAKHPTEANSSSNTPNLLVFFGTGQYLVTADQSSTSTQTFYGVWDKGTKDLNRSNLVAQTFLTGFPADVRVPSDNAVNYNNKSGWYIDLDSTSAATGERVITNPKIRDDYVFFNTMIPNTAACSFGGSSWLMSVKLVNGGNPDKPVFDYNNDNKVDSTDKVTNGSQTVAAGGRKIGSIAAESVFLGKHQYTANSGENIDERRTDTGNTGGTGRLSWREIRR
ncbi:MAG: hypothetical protein IDH49_13155 [Gammaproteobacteria bacterium]|nr:hypothetical protein [Gammaproteobacteria bacterium]